MKQRTDGSVTAVFQDLLAGENAPAPRPSQVEARELHAIAPTSHMVDTQPTDFVPMRDVAGAASVAHPADDADEAAQLLAGAPSSRTMRFASDENPATAFAPSLPSMPAPSVPSIAPSRPSVTPPPAVASRSAASPVLVAVVLTALVSTSVTAALSVGAARRCARGGLGARVCALFR